MSKVIPSPGSRAADFIHLRVRSAYSLLEGALPIARIAKLAVEKRLPAIGLTDTSNLYGALEFSDKLAQAGVQPIVGVTLTVDFADRDTASRAAGVRPVTELRPGSIALLAATETGYANLMRLVSRAHLEAPPAADPQVTLPMLAPLAEGLIALTGGPDGPLDQAIRDGQAHLAETRLATLARLFGDRLYVELQRHGLAHEIAVEPELLALADRQRLPIVATNEVYFSGPADFEAHDALLAIAAGRTLDDDARRRVSPEHGLKTAAEMAQVFADLPEAIAATREIAQRCVFRPLGRKPILPRFLASTEGASEADQLAAEAAELARQAAAGLALRLGSTPPAPGFTAADYQRRLAFELDVIARMKFPGYFLIVADFIQWAKAQGIPVGPGRGSGAGSVVAWSLTITDLDPLRFGLLFERFLNPERVSMPDFDIDFCQDRRDEVIRYVQGKYGSDRVAQIITHGKLQARAVLRDVGRVLGMPYGQVDRLTKLVPNNPANPVTLPEAIAGEPRLQEAAAAEPSVARLLEIAQKLEGLYRHASTHAAGMVIGDRPLDELVPLAKDPKSTLPVTQFNWKLVEAAGLVKFDFLGLKTLTVLQKATELIGRGRGVRIDLAGLPLDDPATYELLAQADTVGVFQLESTGMRETLKRLKPDRFEDIMAVTALYRPGPMDNIPTYIHRKHGEEPVDCLHEMLEPILSETYGVIIYQEQVLKIAQVMAGYSLGQADILRKAMGKKDKAIMAKQQAEFVDGAVKNGVKRDEAAYIFELVDKFAGYGFNKAHTAAYAHVAYYTAYLKAHYREEFLAASMTLDLANTDKLALFAAEARRARIAIKPPCVNASEVDFLAEPPPAAGARGAIRYALAALRNVGPAAIETLVAERRGGGTYRDLADLAHRLNPKAFNKRAVETLAAGGAFDALEPERARVHANADVVLGASQIRAQDAADGIEDMFSGAKACAPVGLHLRAAKRWTPLEKLEREFEAVGFYLSGHPLDGYEGLFAGLGIKTYAAFEAETARGASAGRLAGIVLSARERRSQKGNRFAFAQFSDMTGQFEAVIFSDTLVAARDLLTAGTAVILSVEAERDGDAVKLRANHIEPLEAAAAAVHRGYKLVLDSRAMANGARTALELELRQSLKPNGRGEIRLALHLADREIEFALPGRYAVSPSDRGTLAAVPGVVAVVELTA